MQRMKSQTHSPMELLLPASLLADMALLVLTLKCLLFHLDLAVVPTLPLRLNRYQESILLMKNFIPKMS